MGTVVITFNDQYDDEYEIKTFNNDCIPDFEDQIGRMIYDISSGRPFFLIKENKTKFSHYPISNIKKINYIGFDPNEFLLKYIENLQKLHEQVEYSKSRNIIT